MNASSLSPQAWHVSDRPLRRALLLGDALDPTLLGDLDLLVEVAEEGEPAGAALMRSMPDLLILDAARIDEALAGLLAAPPWQAQPTLLLVDAATVDAAAAVLGMPAVRYLPRDATPGTVRSNLRRFGDPGSVADRGHGAMFGGLLPEPVPAGRKVPVDAAAIRALIKARRVRAGFFPPDLFADPAWDMLLDLSAARLEGRMVSVSSLCIAAAVPTTTALRWVKRLCDEGLLLRQEDAHDRRRAFIVMAPATADAMMHCLEATGTGL
ncbi:hypothetical protein [Sandaracinobacteroides saxicola]|uniref:MarR family transcriptional regulator n=1 Tax=Sandaracinobacteroides saxicola TaxID=2759707 RepID=A0A7G5IJM5_9SPHN|nr:hypothetical protein [Sandaracinobacteroides saxicola]QMW23567.1 hypothetical protein H3309_03455 [Sandaracinobacteroides saxicola]